MSHDQWKAKGLDLVGIKIDLIRDTEESFISNSTRDDWIGLHRGILYLIHIPISLAIYRELYTIRVETESHKSQKILTNLNTSNTFPPISQISMHPTHFAL